MAVSLGERGSARATGWHLEKDAALLGVSVRGTLHTHTQNRADKGYEAPESAAGTAVEGGEGQRLQGLVPLKSLPRRRLLLRDPAMRELR